MQGSKLNSFARLALVLFAVFCIVTVVKLKLDFNDLEETKRSLEERVANSSRNVEELQNRLNTPFDDDYVARVAKDKLNLVMPDEIIFYNDLTN